MEPEQANLWGVHISGNHDWLCAALYGVVGSAISIVEVRSENQVISRSVESPIGVVVVAVDGRVPQSGGF
jgi:hypothetical protein